MSSGRQQQEWDNYFCDIAEVVRQKSKDPSSKIGAVLVRDNVVVSTGFNGFPRGIEEIADQTRWERPAKYQYVSHAEANAILNAGRNGISTVGTTVYLVGFGPPTVPCIECTKTIIQAGISRVVGRAYKEAPADWKDNLNFASELLSEAHVIFTELALA